MCPLYVPSWLGSVTSVRVAWPKAHGAGARAATVIGGAGRDRAATPADGAGYGTGGKEGDGDSEGTGDPDGAGEPDGEGEGDGAAGGAGGGVSDRT